MKIEWNYRIENPPRTMLKMLNVIVSFYLIVLVGNFIVGPPVILRSNQCENIIMRPQGNRNGIWGVHTKIIYYYIQNIN